MKILFLYSIIVLTNTKPFKTMKNYFYLILCFLLLSTVAMALPDLDHEQRKSDFQTELSSDYQHVDFSINQLQHVVIDDVGWTVVKTVNDNTTTAIVPEIQSIKACFLKNKIPRSNYSYINNYKSLVFYKFHPPNYFRPLLI